MSVTIQAVIKSPSQVPMAATFMKVWFSIPIRWLACILSMYLPTGENGKNNELTSSLTDTTVDMYELSDSLPG